MSMPKAATVASSTELAPAEIAARLRLSSTRLARQLRREAALGRSPSQLSALAVIDAHGPLTLGALAEFEGVAPPSITKVVAILEDDGLVLRTPDPADRRVSFVAVTPKGAALHAESKRRRTAWLTGRVRELTARQRQQLADALDVLDELTKSDSQ
jgi:DNA-binding MarR family transcriptional regulator